jgi:peptidoglycan/LPS O-acetylase OafA/YrhL
MQTLITTRALEGPSARPPQPGAPRRRHPRQYWPGLDGMRAIAIAAVVAYHMAPRQFPGGFFGVDVFFVISGYLITSMLVREWSGRGGIDLKRFWWHRVRRLYPAAVVLIVLVVLIAAAVAPATLVPTRAAIPAVLFYVTNWWYIFHRVPYFQALGRPPLLLPFWSLAIEEQYYLVWPPILLLLLSRWRRPGRVAGLALLGAVASSVLMAALFHPGGGIDRIYYGSDTHCQGLLLGSALGLLVPPGRLSARVSAPGRRCLDAAGLVALAGIVTMMATVGQGSFTWRGGLVLVVVLSGVATVVAAHPASRMSRGLALRPLRWLGTRSYSVYLWHWPILDLTRGHRHGGVPLAAVQLVLIAVASELSYRLVETPWRTGRAQRRLRAWLEHSPRHRRTTLAGVGVVVVVIVALLASATTPIPPELRIEATASARARLEPVPTVTTIPA